jgi:aspartate/methionine/tyrosine aminotransferase
MFQEFKLERWMSEHEQRVRYELADSGVPALSVRDLLELGLDLDRTLDVRLHYPEVNGSAEVRRRIAALYPHASAGTEVLVTVGAVEAGGLVVDALTDAGDKVAVMRPNYQQLAGVAANLGRRVTTFSLDPSQGWALSGDELERAAAGASLVAVCNPNNPTGHVLSAEERQLVVSVARQNDAWLLADEVYVGTEHDEDETVSLLGDYEKTVAISSFSKAYGMPGLRLGWVIGPERAVSSCWMRHEYATIATGALSMALAEFVLEPDVRKALFRRNRSYIVEGHRSIREWVSASPNLGVSASRATPVAFIHLRAGVSSVDFARNLVEEASVLVAPGEYFGGFDDHVRITAARHPEELEPALSLMSSVLGSMAVDATD